MQSIVVVDEPKKWPFDLQGVSVISARDYLGDRSMSDARRMRVFNLCKSYRYQSLGYYVSLLALARGHTPLPSIVTIQDMRSASLSRVIADELAPILQRQLKRLRSDRFVLSVYFGRNLARTYDELSGRIFRLFQAPLIQARFRRVEDGWWLQSVRPMPSSEVPESHRPFVLESTRAFFEKNRLPRRTSTASSYDMAILLNGDASEAPSNNKAIKNFISAARRQRVQVECISRADYGRLSEFDALFIRETTQVDHYTYRFARRAAAEGLVVIDDPDSIIKCTNKVYLAELLGRHRVATPDTIILSRENRTNVLDSVKYPVIVKQPDSSFSQGVFKVGSREELDVLLDRLFEDSELLILQEFLATAFDWRIGVINREAFFACKYHMVKSHWQIMQSNAAQTAYGDVEAVALEAAPKQVVKAALRAANAIGDGLYGVDVKQCGKRIVVIEVNDNPNIDAACEDAIIGKELYDRVIRVFVDRINQRRAHGGERE